jgi:hypothetical protein
MNDLNSVQYLFGAPFYKTKIDSNLYDKLEVIDTIKHNYSIDPNRNKWSSLIDIHQLNGDYNNPTFKDFSKSAKESLSNLYNNSLRIFFDSFLEESAQFKFHMINYTCMLNNQYMIEHEHACDFSAVHYIKFNKNVHLPTFYINPMTWGFYSDRIFTPNWQTLTSDNSKVKNSYMHKFFNLDVEEDDFVVTPGPLRHFVPASSSNELRMTIILNIKFV